MTDLDFGDFLALLLRRRRLSLATLAARLGIAPSTLSRLRSGQRPPRRLDLERWTEVLDLSADERDTLRRLALLAVAPASVRGGVEALPGRVASPARTSGGPSSGFYDGWWLAYNHVFSGDGRIQRSLLHLRDGQVAWMVEERGESRFSYRGDLSFCGDRLFVRLEEERGGAEFVQVALNGLFEFTEPTFLHGIVAGLSGTSLRHPVAWPAAARILLIFVLRDRAALAEPERLVELRARLGAFAPTALGGFAPQDAALHERLRSALELRPREDLDAACLRLIGNRVTDAHGALRADFATA